jgi:DNA-binding transcriptional regulator of glucitol operon
MDQAAEILLIITSSVLIIFLILAIVVCIQLLKVLKQIKRVTSKAESLTETIESVGQVFADAHKTSFYLKLFKIFSDRVSNSRRDK